MAEDLGKSKPGKESMASQDGSKASAEQHGGSVASPQDSKVEIVDDKKQEKAAASTSNVEPPNISKTNGLDDKNKDGDDDKKPGKDPVMNAPNVSSTVQPSTSVDDKKPPQSNSSKSGGTAAAVSSSNEASASEGSKPSTQGATSLKKESTTTTTTATSTQPPEPSNKKRKLPSVGASGTPTSATIISTPSLADSPVVTRMVQNIFTLLMTYGPMTQPQLEFNLPPLQGERLNQHNFIDILELLVATGLIQKEDVGSADARGTEPRYCVLSGATRPHPTTPAKILQEIQDVQDEWRASLQRQAKLKEALLDPTVDPRESLKNLLLEFPEVAYDPVYLAAMRNLNVDAGPELELKSSSSRPRSSSKRKRKPSSASQQKSANATNPQSKGSAAATTASKGPSTGGVENEGETSALATKSVVATAKTAPKEAVQPSAT